MMDRRHFLRAGLASAGAGLHSVRTLAQLTGAPGAAPRASVMIWTLGRSINLMQRLDTVANAGYRYVELVDEFRGWSDQEFASMGTKLKELGLSVDAMAGLKTGFAQPGKEDAYLAELRTLITVAKRLQCPQLILLSGPVLAQSAPGEQRAAGIATLKRASSILSEAKMTAVIEPIDRLENPTIYLDGVTEAFGIVREVASSQIKVLYDLYHEQRSHGNLIEKLEKNIADVGLIHVADVPGRHEPGTGEMNYAGLYRALARLHYTGYVAMEFYPTADPAATLKHAREDLLHAFGREGVESGAR